SAGDGGGPTVRTTAGLRGSERRRRGGPTASGNGPTAFKEPLMTLQRAQAATRPCGYAAAILRVDHSSGLIGREPVDDAYARAYLGGVGIGAKVLYDEVPPEVEWDHPENRLVLGTGPLAGTPVWGTGGLTVVTRGALTNGATSTQANGFFGSNLKSSGY